MYLQWRKPNLLSMQRYGRYETTLGAAECERLRRQTRTQGDYQPTRQTNQDYSARAVAKDDAGPGVERPRPAVGRLCGLGATGCGSSTLPLLPNGDSLHPA